MEILRQLFTSGCGNQRGSWAIPTEFSMTPQPLLILKPPSSVSLVHTRQGEYIGFPAGCKRSDSCTVSWVMKGINVMFGSQSYLDWHCTLISLSYYQFWLQLVSMCDCGRPLSNKQGRYCLLNQTSQLQWSPTITWPSNIQRSNFRNGSRAPAHAYSTVTSKLRLS